VLCTTKPELVTEIGIDAEADAAPVIVSVQAPAATGVTVNCALGPCALVAAAEATPLHVPPTTNVLLKPACDIAKVCELPAPTPLNVSDDGAAPTPLTPGVGVIVADGVGVAVDGALAPPPPQAVNRMRMGMAPDFFIIESPCGDSIAKAPSEDRPDGALCGAGRLG
jgi:hypothetical protein